MAARKLELFVDPEKPIVIMKRVFDAPRRLVFEAKTKPEYLKRWYGPHGYTVVSCEMDARVGGAYRIVQRDPGGNEWGFRGVIREITPPSRLSCTWIFEMFPDKETVLTDVFDEQGGKTTMTTTHEFPSFEDREGYLKSGAEAGANASMERLDALLASLL
jgi:uncharacterized protein YndB with AHSA1/START domain